MALDKSDLGLIAGRYTVTRLLGEGASGKVYLCVDARLGGRPVAFKVFPKFYEMDDLARARVARELRIANYVRHDHVVRLYNIIWEESLFGYTMEYVDGAALEQLIDGGSLPPIDAALNIIGQICSGVEAIHRYGMIHRDLKPGNIFLTTDAVVKIGDFGIARELSTMRNQVQPPQDESMPLSNRAVSPAYGFVGTPDYIAPESVETGTCDSRSDIYAIGVIAYEFISGTVPFRDLGVLDMMCAKVVRDPEPLHLRRPDCPADLSRILAVALSRDPRTRYQSAKALRCDLAAFARVYQQEQTTAHVSCNINRGVSARLSIRGGLVRLYEWIRFLFVNYHPLVLILRLLGIRKRRRWLPQKLCDALAVFLRVLACTACIVAVILVVLALWFSGPRRWGGIKLPEGLGSPVKMSKDVFHRAMQVSTAPKGATTRAVTLSTVLTPELRSLLAAGRNVALYSVDNAEGQQSLITEEARVLSISDAGPDGSSAMISMTLEVKNEHVPPVLVASSRGTLMIRIVNSW